MSIEQVLFVDSLAHRDLTAVSANHPAERAAVRLQEIWVNIDGIPPLAGPQSAWPGTPGTPLRGLYTSGVLDEPLTLTDIAPAGQVWATTPASRLSLALSAAVRDGAYAPVITDSLGNALRYQNTVWFIDNLNNRVHFRYQGPERLGLTPPLTISYWYYTGAVGGASTGLAGVADVGTGPGFHVEAVTGGVGLIRSTAPDPGAGLGGITVGLAGSDVVVGCSLTGQNVGGGAPLFKQKAGSDLQFRTLTTADGIGLSVGSDSVAISNTGVVELTAGPGVSVTGGNDNKTITSTGVLALTAGTGISVAGGNDNRTVTNTGVVAAVAGSGISVSAATGSVTFANTGVVAAVAGSGIGVSAATGSVTFANTGVLALTAGTGVTLSGDNSNKTIATTAVLALTAGPGVSLSGDNSNKTITNSGVLALTAGPGITLSGTNANITIGTVASGTSTTVARWRVYDEHPSGATANSAVLPSAVAIVTNNAGWNRRYLNTSVFEAGNPALASRVVLTPGNTAAVPTSHLDMQAGTYKVSASAPASHHGGQEIHHRLALVNMTTPAAPVVLAVGQSGHSGSIHNDFATLEGIFTLASAAAVELQHFIDGTGDLGQPANVVAGSFVGSPAVTAAMTEVYASMIIELLG